MHIQAGQCGNQIGAKVRLSRLASWVPTSASPREGGKERKAALGAASGTKGRAQYLARLLGPRGPQSAPLTCVTLLCAQVAAEGWG